MSSSVSWSEFPLPTGSSDIALYVVAPREMARSSRIWSPHKVLDKDDNEVQDAKVQAKGRSKSSEDKGPVMDLDRWLLADRLVYGLVNIRTDGERIVMAIMNEGTTKFQCESIRL